jgi:hypothetical protein
MTAETIQEVGTNIATAVTITSQAAQVAAPIVAIYNPAAGALLQTLAPMLGPIVSSFVISETGILVNWNNKLTKEEMIKILTESKSVNWEKDGKLEPLV